MPQPDYPAAERAAAKLSRQDEFSLIRELGKRIEDTKQPGGEQRKLQYEGEFVDTSAVQGNEFLEEVGRKWYQNAEGELMKFLCNKKNPDRDKLISGKTIPQVAASLATAGLIAAIAAPPAWAIVATTILAQKITSTGIDALCQVYSQRQTKASKSR